MEYEFEDILDFLGEKNAQRIKDGLTNAILANLEDSVAQRWFVAPDALQEMLNESFAKVYKKHHKEMTAAMEAKMLDIIDEISQK